MTSTSVALRVNGVDIASDTGPTSAAASVRLAGSLSGFGGTLTVDYDDVAIWTATTAWPNDGRIIARQWTGPAPTTVVPIVAASRT